MDKKRILIINEFSQLATGFSTYGKYLLPRLFNSDKYELAEFAVYVNPRHPDINKVPWKVYVNEPDPDSQEEQKVYHQDPANQFGKWRFDEVLIDYQPDIVISWRDFWMDEFIEQSPLRRMFKWIHMPTVDGEPQKKEWMDVYRKCDRLLTYSLWGKNVLERQSCGSIKVHNVASPCPDTEIFVPQNKPLIREKFNLDPDAFIIQSVMRNQPRKLYPDMMKGFVKFLEKCREEGRDDLASKTFLHLHTTYPDVGWDLPNEIREHNLSHKVLFTYLCEQCGNTAITFYQGDSAVCPKCGHGHFRLPNTVMGVDRETLAEIMGCADLYVQYSVSEGYGMPINDAKACGVPVMTVQHSAMIEQAHNGGGIPIPVKQHFHEPLNQTNQIRAWPDNDAFANLLYEFFTAPQENRDERGKEARECVEKYYQWDQIAEIWMDAIDTLPCYDRNNTWLSEPILRNPQVEPPPNLTNEQFVSWCYNELLGKPEEVYSNKAQRAIGMLNLGYEPGLDGLNRPMRNPFNKEVLLNSLRHSIDQQNKLEIYRYNRIVRKDEIEAARPEVLSIEI